jgi:hypothetical protein
LLRRMFDVRTDGIDEDWHGTEYTITENIVATYNSLYQRAIVFYTWCIREVAIYELQQFFT